MTRDDTVRLGFMPPLTGVVDIYGPEITWAGRIACKEVNDSGGVLGKPLELIIEDDGSLPESAVSAAEKLVDQRHCVAIIGNLLSNSRIAVAYRVAEPRKIPYLNFSFYEGSILSRYFFHFAALPNQQIDRMIPYMLKTYGPKMFFAGNNYEWPRGSIDAAKRILANYQGEVVGEEYYPIGIEANDVERLLSHVSGSGADVFVPYFAGTDQLNILARFTKRGLKSRMAVVMGHYDEMMASKLPPEVRDRFYSSNTYFMTVDTPENQRYLRHLASMPEITGIWPHGNGILTNFGEGAYLCVKAFAIAANKAGSLAPEALIDALETVRLTGPQGEVKMDPATHHATVNTYLSRCQADGTFKIIERFDAIEPVLPLRYRHLRMSGKSDLDEDIRLQARMMEQMTEAVFLINSNDGTIVYANPGSEKMFGYDRRELIGKHVSILYAPSDKTSEEISGDINLILYQKGVWKGEINSVKKNGGTFWGYVSVSAFTHAKHGEVWMSVYKDITERKTYEIALREREERFKATFEQAAVGIAHVTPDGHFIRINQRFCDIVGYTREEMRSLTFQDITFPDDLETDMNYVRQMLAGQIQTYSMEKRYIHKNGSLVWINLTVALVRNDKGTPDYFISVVEDVTTRKRAEEALRAAKERAETATQVKDRFVSMVSHDLKAPLASISGIIKLLRESSADKLEENQLKALDAAIMTARQMFTLVEEVLSLSRLRTGAVMLNMEFFDASFIAKKIIGDYQFAAREKGITLINEIPDRARIYSDKLLLTEAFQNFVTNAVKFCGNGDRVTFSMETGERINLYVTDTGPGFDPAIKQKISSHESYRSAQGTAGENGTGYGLMIAKEAIETLGGVLVMESEPGKGSRFGASMPLVKPRILVVDDDPAFRYLMSQYLLDLDAEVTEAADGASALDMLVGTKNPPHLIISDIEMPRMTGLDLLTRLQKHNETKSIPVIIISGKHGMEIRDTLYGLGARDFLTKQIDLDDFIPRVRRYVG